MVNDFLKKYQSELFSDKITLKEDIDLLETKIKEENKFLTLLEESNETYFKEFTPRDINSKNIKKAEEIKESLKTLQSALDEKVSIMKFYDSRLNEINALLSENVDESVESCNANNSNEVIIESSSNKDLVNELKSIKNMILIDPYRAQFELEKIISAM